MPSKNAVKQLQEGAFYHVYNRGVEKRSIFNTKKDYRVFLALLESRVSAPAGFSLGKAPLSFYGKIHVLAFCLMPNHFHLLIQQKEKYDMSLFMKSLSNAYVLYFNRQYDRVGSLFQGAYKAALVNDERHLMQVSAYIHRNPISLKEDICHYPYSSYKLYQEKSRSWLRTDYLEGLAGGMKSYCSFVEVKPLDGSDPP